MRIHVGEWNYQWEKKKKKAISVTNLFLPIFSAGESSAKSTFLLLLAQLSEMLLKLDCPPWAQKIAVLPLPV